MSSTWSCDREDRPNRPVPADSAVGAGPGDAHFLDHMGNRKAAQNAFDEDPPTGRVRRALRRA
jgi:hypothetical protein